MTQAPRPIVALSVSDGPDLARFGYLQRHLRQVLGELLIALLRADFRVGYGGDLRRDGYSRELFETLTAAYQRNQLSPRARPAIVHYFALSSWQGTEPSELMTHLKALGKVAETRFVDADGDYDAVFGTNEGLRIVSRNGESEGVAEQALMEVLAHRRDASRGASAAEALTAMRRTMAQECVLRVLASGQVAGYKGRMPGIVEEALLHAAAGRIVVPLAAFGGTSRDVAIALRLLPESAGVSHAETGENYGASLTELDRLAERYSELVMRCGVGREVEALVNADEPTAIAAGVVRLARHAPEEGEGRPRIL